LGVRVGKNHRTGAEKESVTLLLPNLVAKLSFQFPNSQPGASRTKASAFPGRAAGAEQTRMH